MSSNEPKQTPLRQLIEDPAIQRRAQAWAERLVKQHGLAPLTGEDLYQQVMVKLLYYAESGKPREIERPLAYMFGVLSNEARSTFRRLHPVETVPLDEVPAEKLSDKFEVVQRIELGILLTEASRDMDEEETELFYYMLCGYSARQLAWQYGTSHVTVAARMKKLTRKMHETLFRKKSENRP